MLARDLTGGGGLPLIALPYRNEPRGLSPTLPGFPAGRRFCGGETTAGKKSRMSGLGAPALGEGGQHLAGAKPSENKLLAPGETRLGRPMGKSCRMTWTVPSTATLPHSACLRHQDLSILDDGHPGHDPRAPTPLSYVSTMTMDGHPKTFAQQTRKIRSSTPPLSRRPTRRAASVPPGGRAQDLGSWKAGLSPLPPATLHTSGPRFRLDLP